MCACTQIHGVHAPSKGELAEIQHEANSFEIGEISKCRNLKMQKSQDAEISTHNVLKNAAHSGTKFWFAHAPSENAAHRGEMAN